MADFAKIHTGWTIVDGSPVDTRFVDFASRADAIEKILLQHRYRGLKINAYEGGVLSEFWWRDGVTDNQLIKYGAQDAVLINTDQEINDVKDFKASPLVPETGNVNAAINLGQAHFLPLDISFQRNAGTIPSLQVDTSAPNKCKEFLMMVPANNYCHVRMSVVNANSTVKSFEFMAGYDSLSTEWSLLTPDFVYKDRDQDFNIEIRKVDNFGPQRFGIIFRYHNTSTSAGSRATVRLDFAIELPAVGTNFDEFLPLNVPEYDFSGTMTLYGKQLTLTPDGKNYVDTDNRRFLKEGDINTEAEREFGDEFGDEFGSSVALATTGYVQSTVAPINDLLADYEAEFANKNMANGMVYLDENGRLNPAFIPSQTASDVFTVNSQASMLALGATKGDFAIRTDVSKTFILGTESPTVLADWKELPNPTGGVTSWNGLIGAVVVNTTNLPEGSNLYYTNPRVKAYADTLYSPLGHVHSYASLTGKPTTLAASGILDAEPSFSKNSAFNKNFGTGGGTVAQGNDSRINNGQTAFSWGNHNALYLPLAGKAADSSKLEGYTFDVSNAYAGSFDYMVGRTTGSTQLRLLTPDGVKNWLGLGSSAGEDTTRHFKYEGFTLDANLIGANRSGFTYGVNAPYTGPIQHFDANGYGLQMNATFANGNDLAFRTRNGDGNTWNPWKAVWHSGNFNPANYLGVTGKAQTAGLADNAVNLTTPSGTYKHVGVWGVGLLAAGAILVNSAYVAQSANSVDWSAVAGRPANLSQFTNDLGNYGDWLPKAGGSLTGHLNGTSAYFSGYVTTAGGAGVSDGRFKTIQNFDFDLTKLDGLEIHQFEWNEKMQLDEKGRQHYGWIAQDVEAINPHLVMGHDWKKTLNKEELLILEIKRLKQRVEQLENGLER